MADDVQRFCTLWVQLHLPVWAKFFVARALHYLGVWLGPFVASLQWTAAVSKWISRTVEIAASRRLLLWLHALYH